MMTKFEVTLLISRNATVELDIPDNLPIDEFDEYVTEAVYDKAYEKGIWHDFVMESDWIATVGAPI